MGHMNNVVPALRANFPTAVQAGEMVRYPRLRETWVSHQDLWHVRPGDSARLERRFRVTADKRVAYVVGIREGFALQDCQSLSSTTCGFSRHRGNLSNWRLANPFSQGCVPVNGSCRYLTALRRDSGRMWGGLLILPDFGWGVRDRFFFPAIDVSANPGVCNSFLRVTIGCRWTTASAHVWRHMVQEMSLKL